MTDQNKTPGVLTDAIGNPQDEAHDCRIAAPQSPVAPADERAFPGAPVCSVCSTLIGSAPTVSATVPDALREARKALAEVSKTGRMNIGAEQSYNTAHVEEIIAQLDEAINAAPTPPTSAGGKND